MVIYLLIINITAFVFCALDKACARRDLWRIPEKTLLILALIGGAVGLLAGMYTFRHKTKKPLFYVGVPLCIIINAACVYLFYINF